MKNLAGIACGVGIAKSKIFRSAAKHRFARERRGKRAGEGLLRRSISLTESMRCAHDRPKAQLASTCFFAEKEEQGSGRTTSFKKENRNKANFAPIWRAREDLNL